MTNNALECIVLTKEDTTTEHFPLDARQEIVNLSRKYIGYPAVRYKLDSPELGRSADGFDCSGFVTFVLRSAGLHIPDYIGMDDVRRPIRHANELWDHYGLHRLSSVRLPGDLVIFSRKNDFPTHVGIISTEDNFIHSPGLDGKHIEEIKISDYPHLPIGYKIPAKVLPNPTYRYHQTSID